MSGPRTPNFDKSGKSKSKRNLNDALDANAPTTATPVTIPNHRPKLGRKTLLWLIAWATSTHVFSDTDNSLLEEGVSSVLPWPICAVCGEVRGTAMESRPCPGPIHDHKRTGRESDPNKKWRKTVRTEAEIKKAEVLAESRARKAAKDAQDAIDTANRHAGIMAVTDTQKDNSFANDVDSVLARINAKRKQLVKMRRNRA